MVVSNRDATAATNTAAHALDLQALRLALVAALSLAAWIALAAWSSSPYARYLEHGGWTDGGLFGELCRSLPQGTLIVPALVYAVAWLLMITAMMVPTTLPLLGIFGRVVSARPDAGALLGRVVAGYAIAWLGFGLLAHGIDSLLHAAAAQVGWLTSRGWAVGAVVLAGAGVFQFSALKYRCLERCRTPFTFINARWQGRAPRREALRIGLEHGIFCVGCCWALMAVMFVVGMGSLGWMLVLAAAMAAEKNLRWGKQLRTPLGLGLIAWAGILVAANV
jgi:predicted metal-binding membrane protein